MNNFKFFINGIVRNGIVCFLITSPIMIYGLYQKSQNKEQSRKEVCDAYRSTLKQLGFPDGQGLSGNMKEINTLKVECIYRS